MAKVISIPVETSPPVRTSYIYVVDPTSHPNNPTQLYYTCTTMLDKANADQMAWLKKFASAAKTVLEWQWPDITKRPRIPLVGHTDSVIKDGDTTLNRQGVPLKEKNPEYAGHWLIRAASKAENGPIVVRDANGITTKDKTLFYGGCWCLVNVNPYARLISSNQGISPGLNGVQKVRDDKSFGGGRPSAESMFGPARPDAALNPHQYAGVDPLGQAANNPLAGADDTPF